MDLRLFTGALLHAALAAVGAMLIVPGLAVAQDSLRTDSVDTPAPADTLQRKDTLQTEPRSSDTTRTPPTDTSPTAGAPAASRSGQETPKGVTTFSARDSLMIVFDKKEGDVGTLYGNSEVGHNDATLTAYRIAMYMATDEVRATGSPPERDTTVLPQFQRGGQESFTGRELAFNLRTERGRVLAARTAVGEGYIDADAVKAGSDSTLFLQNGSYTTCNCPPDQTPSYSLRADRMKVKDKWVYTGPIQLFIFNIPTPLILPFAFLPNTVGRRSGILPPNYGEDNQLGFYLKDFGYYWAINDYLDLQITGGLWTQGSWRLSPRFRYNRRYNYSGDLRVSYQRSLSGDLVDADYTNVSTSSLRWSHNQTINPTTRLNGNINLVSSETFLRSISDRYDDNVRQSVSSNINFSKQWPEGGRNLGVVLSQNQNFASGNVSLTLPRLSFSQSRLKPFEPGRRGPGQEQRWYERITTSYRGELNNRYDFTPLPDSTLAKRGATDIAWYDALISPSKYRRATGDRQPFNLQASHRIPVSAPFNIRQVPLLGRIPLNVSPNFNYREEWFTQAERRRNVGDTTIVTRPEPGFFTEREFDLGASANTTFYGLFPVRVGPFSGLRHTVRPRFSFSYQPDLSGSFWKSTDTYRNLDGETVRYDLRSGNRVRRRGPSSSLSFSLDNTFETKRVRTDSTGTERTRTIKLLDADASSRYDFTADSLRLGDINLSLRSNVLERFNVDARARMTFSPYTYENGRKVNKLVLNQPGWRLLRLTRFNFSASTSFQGGEQGGRASSTRGRFGDPTGLPTTEDNTPVSTDDFPEDRPPYQSSSTRYVDFSVPWSVSLDFTYRLTNTSNFSQRTIANANFSFNPTPRWKISGVTGYDFTQWELSSTRLNVTRDFECWQMSFNWTPFGRFQQYGFSLRVKSGMLGNLLNLRLPRTNVKDRFRGVLSN